MSLSPFVVAIPPRSPDRFRAVLAPEQVERLERAIDEGRRLLDGHVVWNVNSTAKGGGVVELLRPLVGYARGAGVDARWVVIEGTPEFFAVTKRIHNRLHGAEGDGGALDEEARHVYESVLAENLAGFPGDVQPGDVVIVHDPQPAGLIGALKERGAAVIWRCHVGIETPNDLIREAWAFLRPYVHDADVYVFSRESFAWEGLDRDRLVVIHPTIDAFAPKNVDIDRDAVRAILAVTGLVPDAGGSAPITFERQDGTAGRVERRARLIEDAPLAPGTPVVLQVSRWDALKDPIGVIRGFAEHVPERTGAHLVYAAPDVAAVADDPEGRDVRIRAVSVRERLQPDARRRVHLASLPLDDVEENARIVNALQRHARVVVQKSLAEGFALPVAEAMWKGRPVVGSRIPGIEDQIDHAHSGVLLDDPRDLRAFGAAVTHLLDHPALARALGERAHELARNRFAHERSLLDYLELACVALDRASSRSVHA